MAVTVFIQYNAALLRDLRKTVGAKLWRFVLSPQDHPSVPTEWKPGPVALNTHNLSIIGSLVRYLHMVAVFTVNSTWLTDIKAGNFTSWPGLTYVNASKYCPVSVWSLQGHLTQARKGVRSTKSKAPTNTPLPGITIPLPNAKAQGLLIHVETIRKLYRDDIGRFPIFSRSGNHYIMLDFHVNTNAILV